MKYLIVVGARPQFIKAAALSRAAAQRSDLVEVMVHTGQHYDDNLSQIFFDELEIPRPAYHLGIGSGSHAYQTGRMLEAIETVIVRENPEWVVVVGDTNSTLAGALAAAKMHIPVAHVEAGLRSFNRRMPEEINRLLTDHVAELLFTPTETAVRNLQREGIAAERIRLCGDVMFDASLFYAGKALRVSTILIKLNLVGRPYVLATIHRAENTDDSQRLTAIIQGLCQVSEQMAIVLPLHPRTRKALRQLNLLETAEKHIHLIEPVGYLDMIKLERSSRLVVTDSGGMQKEAFFAGVPCVTLRDETEWIELVELGWNRTVSPEHPGPIAASIFQCIYQGPPSEYPRNLYGGGNAGELICKALVEYAQPLQNS